MITSFEVGAVFKIVNEASPALTKMLRQVRELTAAVDKARASFAELSKGVGSGAGLTAAIGETKALSAEWKGVAENAAKARVAMTAASGAARTPSLAAGGGRGALGNRLGMHGGGGGGGAHITGPGIAMPGGGHVSFRGGAAAAAGLIGYGAYEAAEMEDAVWQLIYHSGQEQNDTNRSRFRKILQNAMATSGYGLRDIAESAKQEIRMFQGTPGGGLDVLPEMLRAATIESRLKGESPEESMKAFIGLAHMTKQYSPDAIKKLAPAFAFLSTANPNSLGSIEKAAGYAVPLMQSGLEIDPTTSLLLGTALTRAGATSTKSGTWLREMALRAMPGTMGLMTGTAYKKHEEALKAFGLVDSDERPTWFTGGKPDIFKMLDIAGAHAAAIPLDKRAAYERALFGAQGGGGFALLSDPAVRDQVQSLRKTMDSSDFRNRYAGFMQSYNGEVTAQGARTAFQEFNVTMMDIGAHTLPAVNGVLKDFRAILESFRTLLPKASTAGTTVGTRVLEGAGLGAAGGFAVAGPVGAAVGALGGGILGTAAGFMQTYSQAQGAKQNQKETDAFVNELKRQGSTGAAPKAEVKMHTEINLDGQKLASAISQYIIEAMQWSTSAPAADGLGIYDGGGQ